MRRDSGFPSLPGEAFEEAALAFYGTFGSPVATQIRRRIEATSSPIVTPVKGAEPVLVRVAELYKRSGKPDPLSAFSSLEAAPAGCLWPPLLRAGNLSDSADDRARLWGDIAALARPDRGSLLFADRRQYPEVWATLWARDDCPDELRQLRRRMADVGRGSDYLPCPTERISAVVRWAAEAGFPIEETVSAAGDLTVRLTEPEPRFGVPLDHRKSRGDPLLILVLARVPAAAGEAVARAVTEGITRHLEELGAAVMGLLFRPAIAGRAFRVRIALYLRAAKRSQDGTWDFQATAAAARRGEVPAVPGKAGFAERRRYKDLCTTVLDLYRKAFNRTEAPAAEAFSFWLPRREYRFERDGLPSQSGRVLAKQHALERLALARRRGRPAEIAARAEIRSAGERRSSPAWRRQAVRYLRAIRWLSRSHVAAESARLQIEALDLARVRVLRLQHSKSGAQSRARAEKEERSRWLGEQLAGEQEADALLQTIAAAGPAIEQEVARLATALGLTGTGQGDD